MEATNHAQSDGLSWHFFRAASRVRTIAAYSYLGFASCACVSMNELDGTEGERQLAELAMEGRATADLSDLQERRWPSVANRIREARMRTGLTDTEASARLGMTVDSYDDLELHGDEAFTVASLRDLDALGRILGVKPRVLLLGKGAEGTRQAVTFGELVARLTERISEGGLTAEQLSNAIGWDIKDLLSDPNSLWGFTVEALYDICKTIGCDWVAALPESAAVLEGKS
jgi:transcriptional regulator with XRE-family HTH domain